MAAEALVWLQYIKLSPMGSRYGLSRGRRPERSRQPLLTRHASRNALDPNDIPAALTGIDAVILTLGIRPGPEMLFRPVRLFSTATRVIVSAMQRARVARLICVTGFGAGESRKAVGCLESIPFQLFLGRAYEDKSLQEQLIRDSGLDWVIVRPVILTNGPATGQYQVLEGPEQWRNGFIARADVADFLLRQVKSDLWLRKSSVLRSSLLCIPELRVKEHAGTA